MERVRVVGVWWCLWGTILACGCAGQSAPPTGNTVLAAVPDSQDDDAQNPDRVPPGESKPIPKSIDPEPVPMTNWDTPLLVTPNVNKVEEYDDAIAQAFTLLNDGKEEEALASLQRAKLIQDTPFVQREITRLQDRMNRNAAAERTAQDIHTVLNSGRAEDASRLANDALAQFSDTESAVTLTRLKRQADTLVSIRLDDQQKRLTRAVNEGNQAIQAKNLRAAAIAYEQAVEYGADDAVKQRLNEIRTTLTKYDEARARGAELRRNPDTLEEALAAYQEAAKAWETAQLREDIDEIEERIAARRPRVAIAEFEIRGGAETIIDGETIADEMVNALRGRFDVVERGQLEVVLKELQVDPTLIQTNLTAQNDIARLSRSRYLVVGSVSRLSGLTLHCRLIDLKSGLIAQTARIVAPNAEELVRRIPLAARMLQMSDEEKIAFERQLAKEAVEVPQVVVANAPPPPPPEPQPEAAPPAPIIIQSPRIPELGGLQPADFQQIPVNAPAEMGMQLVIGQQIPVRDRAVQVALQVGDNFFQRGMFVEANRQFEFALGLAPQHRDIRIRIERCRPFLPAPVEVPVVVVRPRLAIIHFIEIGDPTIVPPGLGSWTAEQMAPYFAASYDIVDRFEVYWWMGRLGLTMRDVVINPSARLILARAMNVRYFLIGNIRQTASFNVETHLIDSEFNFRQGFANVHCRHVPELKIRMGEIARLTLLTPDERLRLEQQAQAYDAMLVQAQQQIQANQFAIGLKLYQDALGVRPNSVEVRLLIQQAQVRQRAWEVEEARRIAFEQQRQRAILAQQQAIAIAAAAEQARLQAEAEAAALAEAERQRFAVQQQQAYQQLLVQARFNSRNNQFGIAINFYESALGVRRDEAIVQELVQVRAQAVALEQARLNQQRAAEQLALQQQRDAELARAREQLALQQQRERQIQEERRQLLLRQQDGEYNQLITAARQASAAGNPDEAVARLQTAKRIRPTQEVEKLLQQALIDQARAQAQRQGQEARQALEQQLVIERQRREQAEAEAERNRVKYQTTLKAARSLMAEKKYLQAVNEYQQALLVQQTEEASRELRSAREALSRANAEADAERRRRAEAEQRTFKLEKMLVDARALRDKQQYDLALVQYRTALKMEPNNKDLVAELTKTEQARDEYITRVRRQQEREQSEESFKKLMTSANANLAAKRFDAAVGNLSEALKLKPTDAAAQAAMKQAQAGQAAMQRDQTAQAAASKRLLGYQQKVREGRTALATKQYDAAITAFKAALDYQPGDDAAEGFLRDAIKAKKDADADRMAIAQREEQARQKSQQLQQFLNQAKLSISTRRFDAAAQAVASASKIDPQHPDIAKLNAQIDAGKADLARQQAAMQQSEQVRTQLAAARQAIAAKQFPQATQAIASARRIDPKNPGIAAVEQELAAAQSMSSGFATAMKSGRDALTARKYDEASRFFGEAARLNPNDADAKRMVQEVAKARKADFDDKMLRARTALTGKKYDDAIKLATNALDAMPNDADAKRLIADATKAKNTPPPLPMPMPMPMPKTPPKVEPKTPPKVEPKAPPKADPSVEFNKLVQAAAAAETRGDYQAALNGYNQALRVINDANARKKADFCTLMVDGYRELGAKRFDAATTKFQAALRLFPGDANARAGLTKAQAKKN